jgi:sugar phosphate isomerase/epimerase
MKLRNQLIETTSTLSRRDFLAKGALAAGAGALALGPVVSMAGGADAPPRFALIGFSKPFQKYTPAQTAELVDTVGWDGIEIPVRAKGQIEPERAPDELPKFAEALRRQKRDIYLLATDITSLKTPHAETVLRAMAKLDIKRLRLGFFTYPPERHPAERLKEIAPALKDIADACKELGLQAGFQNHSGAHYVGAPVWDVYSILQSLDPRYIGFCFDIGHATLEGGLSWPTEARLAAPYYVAVFVKDFFWKKEANGWKDTWCPLGEGMVNRGFFERLKKSAYRGPICQHHEYNVGEGPQLLANLQRDLKVLKEWLA